MVLYIYPKLKTMIMKQISATFLFLLLFCFTTYSQTNDWQWMNSGFDHANTGRFLRCRTDLQGNVYAIGSFYKAPFVAGSITLPNTGSGDVLVIKFDSDGKVIWAKSFGGSKSEEGNSIAIDTLGNVYVA